MQYSKCCHCKNDGKMCKFIIAELLATAVNLEYLTNKSLYYSKQEEFVHIDLKLECRGFTPKETEE